METDSNLDDVSMDDVDDSTILHAYRERTFGQLWESAYVVYGLDQQ